MRATLGCLLLAYLAATARADDIGVVVTGEETLQPQLSAGVESWLRDHGHGVTPSPLVPEATNKLIDCFVIEDLGCARGVVEGQSKSPAVVFARVDVSPRQDGTRDFTLVVYWITKGHDPVAERRTCSECTEQGMRDTLGTLLAALVAAPPPEPPDALVVPVQKPVAPPRAEHEQPLVAYGVAGAGAAALITGFVLIAIDQDQPDPRGEQPPTYRDTATGGTLLVLAGAAAIGAGAYLWWRDTHQGGPVAAVTGSSGLVGWSGRF